jgi:hypothetical protein
MADDFGIEAIECGEAPHPSVLHRLHHAGVSAQSRSGAVVRMVPVWSLAGAAGVDRARVVGSRASATTRPRPYRRAMSSPQLIRRTKLKP